MAAFHRCEGCHLIESARRQLAEQPQLNREGVHVVLIPNPDL